MSAAEPVPAFEHPAAHLDAAVMRRQILGIFRFELRRNLWSRRAFGLYFMAFSPVLLMLVGLASWFLFGEASEPQEISTGFAVFFAIYLRISIFLSTLFVFMSAFRSEILERSLHYYFLTPVRRSVLVCGKYLTALVAAGGTFLVGTSVSYLAVVATLGRGATRFLFDGPGLGNLAAYLWMAFLACAGYGALFLLAGLLMRNPVVPAVVILAWESIIYILPAFFKHLSVAFYLKSFDPVPLTENGLLAILAEPPTPFASSLGMALFIVGVLALASWRARTMEISYGVD